MQGPVLDPAIQSSLYMVHLLRSGWSIKALCLLGPETRARRYSVPEQPEPFRLKRGPTPKLGRGREADEKPV